MSSPVLYRECPRCHGKSRIQNPFCIHCGLNLKKLDLDVLSSPAFTKEENVMTREFKIGIWGPRTSGKTTYVAALYNTISDDTVDHKWYIQLDDELSIQTIPDMVTTLKNCGKFPDRTDPVTDPIPYNFLFLPAEKNNRTPLDQSTNSSGSISGRISKWLKEAQPILPDSDGVDAGLRVTFTDVAGERYTGDLQKNESVWASLIEADGLICFLDPASPRDHFSATDKLLTTLKLKLKQTAPQRIKNEKIPHLIAFCFSKIDRSEYFEYADAPEQLIKNLKKSSGQNVKSMLENYALPDRVRFFCVSSIGVDEAKKSRVEMIPEVDCETGDPVTDETGKQKSILGIRNPNEIESIHVLDPLVWLFAQSTIPSQK